MSEQVMNCTYCGKSRTWPTDFPNRHYAKCYQCVAAEEDIRAERVDVGLALVLVALGLAALAFAVVWWLRT